MLLRRFVLFVMSLGAVSAQVDTGAISGLVRDSSGGGIPAVHVKITDESTGLATEVATNPTGLYVSPPLRPGTYVVEARASGFEAAAKRVWFLFEVALCTVLTMYGGGFATIPAFLADLFGPETSAPFTARSSPRGARLLWSDPSSLRNCPRAAGRR